VTRKIAISIVLLSVAYALLLALVTPYANYLIKIPAWWYPTFGHSNLSALTWLHLVNGLFVVACALPVSAIIVRVFPSDWLMVAIAAGVLASTYVLWPGVHNLDVLIDSGIHLLSLAIDFVKYAFIPLILSALIRKAMPSSNALHLPS
jgi:hypothetical protein